MFSCNYLEMKGVIMNNGNNLTSFKTVRRFCKEQLNGDITKEAVIFCQSLLEQYLITICHNVKIQQEEMNRLREFHHLPKLRRYGVSTYINRVGEGYKTPPDWMIEGEQAKPVNTCLSKYKADEEVA
jgi:hypothetical protein